MNVAGCADSSVALFDFDLLVHAAATATRTLPIALRSYPAAITCTALVGEQKLFAPVARSCLTGAQDGMVALWDPRIQQPARKLSDSTETCVTVAGDGMIVRVAQGKSVLIWDLRQGCYERIDCGGSITAVDLSVHCHQHNRILLSVQRGGHSRTCETEWWATSDFPSDPACCKLLGPDYLSR